MTRQRHQPRRAVIVVMAALLGALLAGGLVRLAGDPAPPPRSSELPADVTGPARQPTGSTAASPGTVAAPPPPRVLSIPRLGLRLPVLPRGVGRTGAMALPATVNAVAWYRFGPAPLSDAGATVLAGHVDTKREGAGPLAGLVELEVGDRVRVAARNGTVVYAVTSVTRIRKAVLDLPTLFSRVGRPRLHLITCGGAYLPDRGGYQDNVVVAARRV